MIDPITLTQSLIRCPSVTPHEAGALTLLEEILTSAGFTCTRIERGGVSNLFARWGEQSNQKTFGYNGHTDVVPVGDESAWSFPPFGAKISNGWIYGRGATDMKSSVAAFTAAAIDFVEKTPPKGSIVLTITGDEEGPAQDGTAAILDWMGENNERIDHCLIGEPTCPERLGDMMKIGRRGSITYFLTATGIQGHSAYPDRALNPVPALAELISKLSYYQLDDGSEHFEKSNLEVTTFDVGNPANNVIPQKANATLNIRFNNLHNAESLTEWLRSEINNFDSDVKIEFEAKLTGESFITPLGVLSELVTEAARAVTTITPKISTSGGTSDARFIQSHCPIIEFGLVGKRMHAIDERVSIDDVLNLTKIYHKILEGYFK